MKWSECCLTWSKWYLSVSYSGECLKSRRVFVILTSLSIISKFSKKEVPPSSVVYVSVLSKYPRTKGDLDNVAHCQAEMKKERLILASLYIPFSYEAGCSGIILLQKILERSQRPFSSLPSSLCTDRRTLQWCDFLYIGKIRAQNTM